MNIPPSLAIYLMNKRKQEQPQLKPAVEPMEEINIFHVPAQNAPFPIQGTKLGIQSQYDLHPVENEDDRRQLISEVQLQLENLKNVLRLNKKERFVVDKPVQIEEVADKLSHNEQLELMTELVELRKEVQQLRKGQNEDLPPVVVQKPKNAQPSMKKGQTESPQLFDVATSQREQAAKDAPKHIPSRGSYHSEVNEYPNHYSRRGSLSSESGSCLGIQEDFVQLEHDGIRALNQQFSPSHSSEELYFNSYGPKRRALSEQLQISPRKFDNVNKLPHKNIEKRKIVDEITEEVLSENKQPTLAEKLERYDEIDLLQPRDYSKYGNLRYSDEVLRKQEESSGRRLEESAAKEEMEQSRKIRTYLPIMGKQLHENLLSDRSELLQSNESALRIQRSVNKKGVTCVGNDIFVEMLNDGINYVGRNMVEQIEAELNVRE